MTPFTDDEKPEWQNPVFSDSDLKRLKLHIQDMKAQTGKQFSITLTKPQLNALLARLEAAEKMMFRNCTESCGDAKGKCDCGYSDVYEAWRKAAGK